MSLLPHDKFTLTTKLSAANIAVKLRENVEARSFSLLSRHPPSSKPYEGKVQPTSFSISRIINYRNSFLPIVNDKIIDQFGYTEIVVTMKPHTAIILYLSLWLGGMGFACLAVLFFAVAHLRTVSMHPGAIAMLIPFAMFLFGYGLLLFGYRPKAKKAKLFLLDLLDAENRE